jgi:alkylated DNA nucleotide flippase Atl1
VNGWSEVFLGVIAVATLVMAVIQVAVIVGLQRTARQAQQIMTTVQQEVRPLIATVTAAADEASRTAALTTAQVQKVDRLVTDLARRVDETAAVVQHAIMTPAREGMAIAAGLKAGLAAIRGFRARRERHRQAEEEDSLFIG